MVKNDVDPCQLEHSETSYLHMIRKHVYSYKPAQLSLTHELIKATLCIWLRLRVNNVLEDPEG